MRRALWAFVFHCESALGIHLCGASFGKKLTAIEKLSRIQLQTDPKIKEVLRNRALKRWLPFVQAALDAERWTGEELQRVVH